MHGWAQIAADPPADLDPWAAARLPRLAELEARRHQATAGQQLLHHDARADNMIRTRDGVVLVDWALAKTVRSGATRRS